MVIYYRVVTIHSAFNPKLRHTNKIISYALFCFEVYLIITSSSSNQVYILEHTTMLLFSVITTYEDKPCVFPFIYDGAEHNWCTTVMGSSAPWCGTVSNVDNEPMEWGFCKSKNFLLLIHSYIKHCHVR